MSTYWAFLDELNQSSCIALKRLMVETITSFLSNPIVSLVGYVATLIGGLVAVWQFLEKSKMQKEVERLKLQIVNLQSDVVNNNNKVRQGAKSQYFQDNSGAVIIDNRGK